jgi:hypothetical protein
VGLALGLHFVGALSAQRQVVCGAQVGVHPELTVDERGDGLGGQMFGGAELPRRTDRRIVL